MDEKEKILLSAPKSRNQKKVFACTDAHALSKEKNISLKEIDEICIKNGIKIIEYRLGCFD